MDGAKCSFLRIHCLMMLSLSRIADTLDSGEPEIDKGVITLEYGVRWNKLDGLDELLLKGSTFL